MATDTILIGCKMPHGVVLDLDRYELLNKEQGTVRLVRSKAKPITLKGNALPFGQGDRSNLGYVFTPVPREFWEEWLATHEDSSLLEDGYIIAASTPDASNKIAREREAERGLNPRLVEDDPRSRALGVKKFNKDDERQAA